MVDFNIVEGNDDWMNIYPDFKEDFLDININVSQLKQKYDLSFGKYNYLRKKVLKETGLIEKPAKIGGRNYIYKEDRFIRKNKNGSCTIWKTLNRTKICFGTYSDFETAKMVRDKLVECDWDKKTGEELKKKYGGSKKRLGDVSQYLEDFEKLYLDRNYKMSEIMDELKITRYQYSRLSKIVREKYNINKRKWKLKKDE